jgi:monovalent cation/hydrogen antiporter
LSIPVLISPGQSFPYRNLILIITFVVILVTLVFQGLTLPWVMKKVKLEDHSAGEMEQQQELTIRKTMAESSLTFLENTHGHDLQISDHVKNLTAKLQTDLSKFSKDFAGFNATDRDSLTRYHGIYLAVLDEQRKVLRELNRKEEYDEELIRKYLSLIDLEETKLREVSFQQ